MKNQKILIVLLLLFLSLPSFSQVNPCDALFPGYDKQKKLWGFTDMTQRWAIPPIYTKVSLFYEGRAVVQKGKLVGIIDCDGNIVLPIKYEAITSFRQGVAWVKGEAGWGMVRRTGTIEIPLEYEQINPIPYNKLVWLKKDGLWGLFNEATKTYICNPQYKIAKILSPNCSMVKAPNGLFGVLNHVSCEYLIEPKITSVKKISPTEILYKLKGKWGVFNYEGRIKANPIYDSIRVGNKSLLIVTKAGKEGLMDMEGEVMLPIVYDSIGTYHEGVFPVKKGNKYGYANLLGILYIEPVYDEVGLFSGKAAIVKKDGKFGVIALNKKMLIPFQSGKIERNTKHPFFKILENGGEYLFDKQGKRLSQESFDKIYLSDADSVIRIKNEDKFKYYDLRKNQFVSDMGFDEAEAFTYGYGIAEKGTFWGVINESGKEIVPFNFDKVTYYPFLNQLAFKVEKEGKTGIVDFDGKPILLPSFEKVVFVAPNSFKAKKSGKWGVYTTDGTEIYAPAYSEMSNSEVMPSIPEWPAIVKSGKLFGLLDSRAGEIVKPQYPSIYYSGDGLYALKGEKGYSLIDAKGNLIPHIQYDSIGSSAEGMIPVFNGKKWGYANKEGQVVIKFHFEEAGTFKNKEAVVQRKGKYGVIDTQGNFVVQPEYLKYLIVNGERILQNGVKELNIDKAL